MQLDDTIAAPITAPGQAAVSALRVSGDRARGVLKALAQKSKKIEATPRQLHLTAVNDLLAGEGVVLDHALVVLFPGPQSFSGEDCLEFHLHGSIYLRSRLMENLESLGVRLAGPGEFSERAFHNGRLDLSQAEAVADLIAAETEAQARVAEAQLSGHLSGVVNKLGEPLRDLLAEVEAQIDFPDEDIDPETWEGWEERTARVLEKIESYLETYSTGRLIREGVQVVFLGLPNAGKSSLLNRLVGERRAIVNPAPGTTRDSIEVKVSLKGLAVTFWDTAGLEDGEREVGEIEQEGIERSFQLARQADLNVLVFDQTLGTPDASLLQSLEKLERPLLVVANKIDLKDPFKNGLGLAVSAETGEGLDLLKEEINNKLFLKTRPLASVQICNQRHFNCLEKSKQNLEQCLRTCQQQLPAELVAADIRAALLDLNQIIGLTESEDILGRIFSKFCVGK